MSEDKVLVPLAVLYPTIIRKFLKKSHYYAQYDHQEETLRLSANHGQGGKVLLELRHVTAQTAAGFAELLGLSSSGPSSWGKWNPILHLDHDGSNDAQALLLEMRRLDLPHTVRYGIQEFGIRGIAGEAIQHGPPLWSAKTILPLLAEYAERHKELLVSTP